MSELEKILKSVLLGSVGAVATAVEKTGELARSFVEKGEDVVDKNGLADKGREVADSAKAAIGKMKDRIALGVKGVCLILSALGMANMWLAIGADVGVMILAVLNAIRCLFVKKI